MLALAIGGPAVSSGCRRSATPEPSGAANRLVATFSVEPRSFNRVVSADASQLLLAALMHSSLVRVNRATGQLEPRLAREWSSSHDGRTFTLRLRDDALFSDGMPVTSADVAFTFKAIYDPHVGSQMASALTVGGKPLMVRALDDHTVQIEFPAVFGPGLSVLDSVPILPRHKLGPALDAGTFPAAWAVNTPPADIVGAGPFVLAEYAPGREMRFVRNTKFWGRPLPRLDEIDIQIVPEQNAEMLRLESGQADLVRDFARAEDMATLRQAAAQGRVQLIDAGVDIRADSLWFNLAPGAPRAKERPWLQREELRKAISYAIDRQAVIDTVYLGAAVPLYGPITPGHGDWYTADLPGTPHDVAKAKSLLASIGLLDRNGDGMLEDARGNPARFSIVTTKGNTARERVSSMLQSQLRQVGLQVDVVAQENRQVFSKSWAPGDYDAIYYGFQFDAIDPARNQEFWLSSGSFHVWNPQQARPATSWEAEIDALMVKQTTTLDPAERRRIFRQAQIVLAEHMPCIYVAAPRLTAPMSARVSGAVPSVLSPPILWNAESLSVTSARR